MSAPPASAATIADVVGLSSALVRSYATAGRASSSGLTTLFEWQAEALRQQLATAVLRAERAENSEAAALAQLPEPPPPRPMRDGSRDALWP